MIQGPSNISAWGGVALAFLSSVLFVVALLRPARRAGLIDHPAGRKAHEAPTVLVGGLAIFLSWILVLYLTDLLSGQSQSLWIALLVTVGIGLADDAHEIGYRSKFFAQLVASLVIVSGTTVHVMYLGDIFAVGDLRLGKWSYLITAIAIIGLMNAINMIDGLDGLAGTQAFLSLSAFSLVAMRAGEVQLAFEMLFLAGAVAGFLIFNLRSPLLNRALVFLGDTGGMLLGLLLAWFSIRLGGAETAPLRPITAVWILAVPLLDMGAVMLLRLKQRKSPFQPDRQHLHYVLIDAGFTVGQVVFMMGALSMTCAVLALLCEAYSVPEFIMFGVFIVLLLAYGNLIANPELIGLRRQAAEEVPIPLDSER